MGWLVMVICAAPPGMVAWSWLDADCELIGDVGGVEGDVDRGGVGARRKGDADQRLVAGDQVGTGGEDVDGGAARGGDGPGRRGCGRGGEQGGDGGNGGNACARLYADARCSWHWRPLPVSSAACGDSAPRGWCWQAVVRRRLLH